MSEKILDDEKKNDEVENQENEEVKATEDHLDSTEQVDASSSRENEELLEWKNKYYYLLAEMDNSRKRFQREKENLIKYGNEKILSNLITVIDNFDHSISALENDQDPRIKNIISGIEMVRKQFLDVLSKEGLERIESMGKDFDPNFHEAMAKQAAEGKRESEIIFEYQKGYILNGRLLRPSKVVVAE